MNKNLLITISFIVVSLLLVISCEKDFKNNSNSLPRPPLVVNSFVEEFDTVANLSARDWLIKNNSFPAGPIGWRQGKYELGGKLGSDVVGFPAYSAHYTPNDFVSVDLNSGSDVATSSAWLIGPARPMKNGDKIIFYTKSHGDYADRMQVRANFKNALTNVGTLAEDVGDFSTLLLDINSTLSTTGYPTTWTKYSVTLTGISGLIRGRFAFRYYVTNAGPSGSNGDMVGVDSLAFVSQ